MGRSNVWEEEDMRDLCEFPCPQFQIRMLKKQFDSLIRSERTSDKIKDVKELLEVLRKRDELTSERLDEVAAIVGFDRRSHATGASSRSYNNAVNSAPRVNATRNVGLTRAYSEIHERLGTHWIDFARHLGMPEGKIDKLDREKDDERRLSYILAHHEERCEPHTWRQTLLNALVKARRQDLSNSVASLLDRFEITDFRNCYS